MENLKILTLLTLIPFLYFSKANAKVVSYELSVENQTVNITGKPVSWALTVNGGIPAPTLEFTEGDQAEITVKNNLKDEEVSIHWHGILLPPEEDGVAYVNTPPIFPGEKRTFKFTLRQHGTYWYHSHTMVQEQKGIYGAFIVHPKKPVTKVDHEAVVVLSDWSDENADNIMKNLKKDGDYYLYKKKSMRSILGAMKAGQLGTYFKNELDRMGGMDLSDVGYDAFLINGKKSQQLVTAHPGEKVRVRIINAGASSYFYISLAGLPFQVISSDGIDVEPVWTKEILMGMAETYDILFTVPEHKNYELRATVQDVTGFASAWVGMGPQVKAPDKMMPDLYAPMDHGRHGSHASHNVQTSEHKIHSEHSMNHAGHSMNHEGMNHEGSPADHLGHHHHSSHENHHGHGSHVKSSGQSHGAKHMSSAKSVKDIKVLETLTVDHLQGKENTELPKGAKVTEFKLVLGGDMERYVWHINGQAIHEDRNIIINEGEIIRFVFVNETMMHHPMHLHGHFFRVLNEFGERSPLKHTVDVPPHGTRVIEFYANEPGQWMLHCHNLYHMKTGMARVIKYKSYQLSPENSKYDLQDPHRHDHWYYSGALRAATNFGELNLKAAQTWNEIDARIEARKDDDWEPEGDLFYRRWFGNFSNLVLGASSIHDDTRGQIGVGYLLPFLIESQLLIDDQGMLRVDLEKRFQWTENLFTEVEYIWRQDMDLKSDSIVSLMYSYNWNLSLGLKYTGHSLGIGLQYQF